MNNLRFSLNLNNMQKKKQTYKIFNQVILSNLIIGLLVSENFMDLKILCDETSSFQISLDNQKKKHSQVKISQRRIKIYTI